MIGKDYIKPWISGNFGIQNLPLVSASRATVWTEKETAEGTPEPSLPPSFWLLWLLLALLPLKP